MNEVIKNTAGIIFFIILLLLATLTAASETSIIAVSRLRLRRLASGGSKSARAILRILEAPERFFGTILVANNIVDALIASILTAVTISILKNKGRGIVLATMVATFLIIVSEVSAKTLAAKRSERFALSLVNPIKALIWVLSPIVRILSLIINWILGFFGEKAEPGQSVVMEEDIRSLIKISETEDVVHKEKYKMLSKVFDFSDTIVRNVMIPRKEIVSINANEGIDIILDKVLESGYSRLPVYKDSPDNIIGIVNMKDLLNLSVNKGLLVLHDIVYPATFVPSSKRVADLLKEFQGGHTHMAIVRDLKGQVEGLITMEDLLEEIVGEIEDEYDIRTQQKKET